MAFEFYYLINDKFENDDDVKLDINEMKYREKQMYEKYGKTLDKSRIPSENFCNNEKYCCPYCVSDRCLLFGVRMKSKSGYYGFSFQHRKQRCKDMFPEGKKLIKERDDNG